MLYRFKERAFFKKKNNLHYNYLIIKKQFTQISIILNMIKVQLMKLYINIMIKIKKLIIAHFQKSEKLFIKFLIVYNIFFI